MKKVFILLFVLAGIAFSATAQESKTIYIMKNGTVDFQSVVSEIDSIIFYAPGAEEGFLPYGEGFNDAEIGASKTFVELGYPGELENWEFEDTRQYGDLWMFHAYCGDNIVLLARRYSDDASSHGIKVVNKNTLADAGALNLGSINISDIKMVSSDYKGRCVAAVVTGNETEFFYWTSTSGAPVSVGKINVNMATNHNNVTPHANFQVSGDITGNAWITALGPLSSNGDHYRVKVTAGKLATSHSIISTGYSSADCTWFQMISPLDASNEPSYVIGDAEGNSNQANSVHCYVNDFAGLTQHIMPAYWQGNPNDDDDDPASWDPNFLRRWWVGTGFVPARSGARAPVVTALPINGKSYVVVVGGTAWYHAATVLNSDLSLTYIDNLNIAEPMNRGWSYGAWADWYYDDVKHEAYLALWFGRLGLFTYKLTCKQLD